MNPTQNENDATKKRRKGIKAKFKGIYTDIRTKGLFTH
jgi:hypothetical protein